MATCKLVVCVCVCPEFINLQVASLRKFMKQPFDYCVVDDSKEESISLQIKKVCEENGYEYLRSPPHEPSRLDASTRHADTLLYGWKNMKRDKPYAYIGTLDSDFFLISPLDLDTVLQEKNILCVKHTRQHIYYFWPGCCIWRTDVHTLEDFHWDICIDNEIRGDTGGTTYYYWKENLEKTKSLELLEYQFLHIPYEQWPTLLNKYLPPSILNFCAMDIQIAYHSGVNWWSDIYADPENRFVFFHFRDVSNWQNLPQREYLEGKKQRFIHFLLEHLQS